MLGGTWPRAVMSAARPSRPCRLLRAVDMLDLQPDHFAGTQAAPIAKTECCAGLEARGNGQHATGLVRAHHLGNLAVNLVPLCARPELARVHVLDHALAEGADGIDTHR